MLETLQTASSTARAVFLTPNPYDCMRAEQTLALVGLGVTTSATWIVWRHAGWAWVLQDLMGLALVLNIIATLRVPTLKVHPSWHDTGVTITCVRCGPLSFYNQSIFRIVVLTFGANIYC
jgi:hypothetical protein